MDDFFDEYCGIQHVAAVITSPITHRVVAALREVERTTFGVRYQGRASASRDHFVSIAVYTSTGNVDAMIRQADDIFRPIADAIGITYRLAM